MSFDVDAWQSTHPPFSLRYRGRVYRARQLGAPVLEHYHRKCDRAGEDLRKRDRATWWLLRHAFPWEPRYLRLGDPVSIILALPLARRTAIVAVIAGAVRHVPFLAGFVDG